MTRLIASAFLFAFFGFSLATSSAVAQADSGNDGIDTNCNTAFFTGVEQARQYFADDGGSASRNVDDLDRNGDGIACNSGLEDVGGNGSQFPGGGSGSGAVEDTDDVAVEEDDSADVALESDDSDDGAAEVTADLPATGTGPLASPSSSSGMLSLLAAGALLFTAAGTRIRSTAQR